MEFVDILATHPAFFIALVGVFSLLVGSFLNVVIHRLPIMMDRQWRLQFSQHLAEEAGQPWEPKPEPKYNLVVPRSCCPKCKAPITAIQNVPIISYLFLRGKCAGCGTSISLRYPLVEFATAILSVVVAIKFGFTWYTAAALVMTWSLICLALIDFDTYLLPDQITLPLVWIGLLLSLWATPDSPFASTMRSSVIGGVAGYLSLWLVNEACKLVLRKEGMGAGDFKLLAAFGTWLGWQPLLLIVIGSAFAGSVIGIGLILFRGRDRSIPIPYGPFLAIAGWIAMLWGNELLTIFFPYMPK